MWKCGDWQQRGAAHILSEWVSEVNPSAASSSQLLVSIGVL